ncbi:MAG: hypothetical protein ICV66_12515, partial [Chitinophagaceae bacterium]|nr:hypothetical protein [Chitinophagaceae bacterium]
MSNFIYNDEWVIRYIDGDLSDDQKTEFEAAMQTNHDLREAVERMQLATKAIKFYGIKQQVTNVHQQLLNEKLISTASESAKVFSVTKFLRYTTAAAAVLLIILISIVAYDFYKLSPEELYKENFVGYNVSVARG